MRDLVPVFVGLITAILAQLMAKQLGLFGEFLKLAGVAYALYNPYMVQEINEVFLAGNARAMGLNEEHSALVGYIGHALLFPLVVGAIDLL